MAYADLTHGPALADTEAYQPDTGIEQKRIKRKRGEEMSEDELISHVQNQETISLGYFSGSIATQRAIALDYFFGEPFGNEVEGRSEVISTDVADAIEGLLPGLLKPFISSDHLLEFNPSGPHDEDAAHQESDYCNYVITQKNNGPLILYTWFKDALMQKNGFVKYYWDEEQVGDIERYKGLTMDDLAYIIQDLKAGDIQILSARSYPDPDVSNGGMAGPALSSMPAQAGIGGQSLPPPNPGMAGPPGIGPSTQPLPAQPMPGPMGLPNPPAPPINPLSTGQAPLPQAVPPPPMLYDLTLRKRTAKGKCTIENVPPEELLVSVEAKTISIKNARFVEHRRRQTLSEIRQMGFYIEDDIAADQGELLLSPEYTSRREFEEIETTKAEPSPENREVLFRECYIRIDYDGDGIAELRKVCIVGNRMLHYDKDGEEGEACNEEAEEIPFCVICPYIIPHKFYGQSVADKSMDIQLKTSALERIVMDNLYTLNNNRLAISENVNLDDVLDEGIPGIVRIKSTSIGNDIMPLPVTPVGDAIYPMLERLENQKMIRIGYTPMQPEMDANAINKTATGVNAQTASTQERQELIARMFAETGVKDLMQSVHGILRRHATEPETIKLRGSWVQIDPRDWVKRMDMTVTVGLGTGTKQQTIQNMQIVTQLQQQAGQLVPGLVTPKNGYNALSKMTEAMGYKDSTQFWTDPTSAEGQQAAASVPKPPPDPKLIEAQTDQQRAQQEAQADQANTGIKQHELTIKQQELAIRQQELDNEKMKTEAEFHLSGREMKLKEDSAAINNHMTLQQHKLAMAAQEHQFTQDKKATDGAQEKQGNENQSMTHMTQVFEKMHKVLSAPKKIIKDKTGEPIGLMADLGE